MKSYIKYRMTYERMKNILQAFGLKGETRYSMNIEFVDIRMHDMIVGSLELDSWGRPIMMLAGGNIVSFFHHDGRKASIYNAIVRFDMACSMIVDDCNYMDISNRMLRDIKENGR